MGKSYLDEVEVQVQVPADQICRDIASTKDAVKRHNDLSEDFAAHKPQIEQMEEKAKLCDATEIADALANRYNNLQAPIAVKSRKLDEYSEAYDLQAELADVDD